MPNDMWEGVIPELSYYEGCIKGKTCFSCHTGLTGGISHYAHLGGWAVKGFTQPQWLYTVCPKCEIEWALWKLGVDGRVPIEL